MSYQGQSSYACVLLSETRQTLHNQCGHRHQCPLHRSCPQLKKFNFKILICNSNNNSFLIFTFILAKLLAKALNHWSKIGRRNKAIARAIEHLERFFQLFLFLFLGLLRQVAHVVHKLHKFWKWKRSIAF